jgi:hypothetical protein
MRIAVRKEPKEGNHTSRRITRADVPTKSLSWGYTLLNSFEPNASPSLSVTIDGNDGNSYQVNLTRDDILAIVEAVNRYKEHFGFTLGNTNVP